MNKILKKPQWTIIEVTAANFATTFYEAGMNTGMKSKYKNAREYAFHNLELFLPKALEILVDMLGRDDVSRHMKDEIHAALTERANDPEAIALANKSQHLAENFKLPPEWRGDAGEGVIKPEIIKAKEEPMLSKPKFKEHKDIKKGLLYG